MSLLEKKLNLNIISHEKYINSLYSNVEGLSYKIKPEIFAIKESFNISKPKIDNCEDANNKINILIDTIHSDINIVQECYNSNKLFISNILNNMNSVSKSCIINNPKMLQSSDLNYKGDHNSIKPLKRKHERYIKNQEAIQTCNELLQQSIPFKQPFESFFGCNSTKDASIRKFQDAEFLFPPNSKFHCKFIDKTLKFDELFDIIVMDPPWWNKAIRRKNLKANNGYPMMYNDDIKELPINSWLNNKGVVIVWCTNSSVHLQAVKDFFKAWKLSLCAKWYWLKVTQSGEPITPFSNPPRKQPFEQILIGTKSHNSISLWSATNGKIIVSVPSAIHSHKPPLVDIIKEIVPNQENLKGLELFARYLLPNWTSVGIEVLKLQNICFYTTEKNTTIS